MIKQLLPEDVTALGGSQAAKYQPTWPPQLRNAENLNLISSHDQEKRFSFNNVHSVNQSFNGDLVYKFKNIVGRADFFDQFRKKYRSYWI